MSKDFELVGPSPLDDLDKALKTAEFFSRSSLVPSDYKNKPENILLSWQAGYEVGLKPMQSLTAFAIIKGKPVMYAETALALVSSHPDYGGLISEIILEDGKFIGKKITIMRKGRPDVIEKYTIHKATRAGLMGSQTYQKHTEKMFTWRAIDFAVRLQFADVLAGVGSTIVMDEEREIFDEDVPEPTPPALAPSEEIDDDDEFLANLKILANEDELEELYDALDENQKIKYQKHYILKKAEF